MNRFFAAVLFSLLLLGGSGVAEAELPARPAGPVYDGAAVIPDATEARIDAKLRALSKDTGKTLIVATVPSLNDRAIEDYAVELFETWGIGDAEKDEGALILVAPNERRTRIEVGLGSEAVLPDALAGRIIDQQMIPLFKQGDFGGGIDQATDAVITQLRREPTDARAVAAAAERAARQGGSEQRGASGWGMVLFWLFILFFFILPLVGSFTRGGRKYRGKRGRDHWGGPVIIWGGGSDWGGSSRSSWGGGGGFGGGFGGFGGGISGGGGASGGW